MKTILRTLCAALGLAVLLSSLAIVPPARIRPAGSPPSMWKLRSAWVFAGTPSPVRAATGPAQHQ